jgi:hypothetical protein
MWVCEKKVAPQQEQEEGEGAPPPPPPPPADLGYKLVQREISYVPGLYKIFDEILVNAAGKLIN